MKDRKFERVLGKADIFALAFGAMIGWGWVILAGDWIQQAGTLGAMIAFVLGGLMVVFVGLTYAELTSAMPECGGEHVFSHRALGANGSFICTWAIILGYIGVVAFEACSLPNVVEYIAPGFLQGYMYSIAGFDVYGSWVALGVVASILITIINFFGVKSAAFLQGVLTIGIAAIGIALMFGAGASGDVSNAQPLFHGEKSALGGILAVATMTPFMFVGFDVIPQAAEEINVPFKKIGKIMISSIVTAVIWYIMIIAAVAYVLPKEVMEGSTLVVADAMKAAFHGSDVAAKILIIAGMAGIVSSWNAFFIGGSRAIFALAESQMLPACFAKLHPKYKTPTNAILLVGFCSCIAPFFGRKMMVWLVDAGSFAVVVAYMLVCISYMILRKKEPEMKRPYSVKNWKFVGTMAILLTVMMAALYVLPGFSSALVPQEWIIVGAWALLGVVFYLYAKGKYPAFGHHEIREHEDIVHTPTT